MTFCISTWKRRWTGAHKCILSCILELMKKMEIQKLKYAWHALSHSSILQKWMIWNRISIKYKKCLHKSYNFKQVSPSPQSIVYTFISVLVSLLASNGSAQNLPSICPLLEHSQHFTAKAITKIDQNYLVLGKDEPRREILEQILKET